MLYSIPLSVGLQLENQCWQASDDASQQLIQVKADLGQQLEQSQERVQELEQQLAKSRSDNQTIEAYTTQERREAAETNEQLAAQIYRLQKELDVAAEREEIGMEENGRYCQLTVLLCG